MKLSAASMYYDFNLELNATETMQVIKLEKINRFVLEQLSFLFNAIVMYL